MNPIIIGRVQMNRGYEKRNRNSVQVLYKQVFPNSGPPTGGVGGPEFAKIKIK